MARQVLFHGAQQDFECVEVSIPELNRGEVLVQIRCCMLCRSDLHTHSGRRQEPTPCVLGHEMVGTIAAFGPDSSTVDACGVPAQIGDRITWPVVVGCGECYFCRADLPQKCEQLHKYGHMRNDASRPLGGGLADYIILANRTQWLHVPSHLPDVIAASANCATATIAAVLNAAGNVNGQTVLIFGAGMLGLTAAAMCSVNGASQIIVLDPHEPSQQRARRFGATHTCGNEAELTAILQANTNGRGADIVLELSGQRDATIQSVQHARIGGHIVWAGSVSPAPAIDLAAEKVVRRMLHLYGVHNYHPRDLITAVQFLAGPGTRFPFGDLVGERFPLSEINQAFTAAQQQPGLRVAVLPELPA